MGLFRLLAFILVVIVAWSMIKNYRALVAKSENNSEKAQIPVREKMVKCEFCSIHIPKEEAIAGSDSDGEYWFCTPDHKASFNQRDS